MLYSSSYKVFYTSKRGMVYSMCYYVIQNPFQAESKQFQANCRALYCDVKGWQYWAICWALELGAEWPTHCAWTQQRIYSKLYALQPGYIMITWHVTSESSSPPGPQGLSKLYALQPGYIMITWHVTSESSSPPGPQGLLPWQACRLKWFS